MSVFYDVSIRTGFKISFTSPLATFLALHIYVLFCNELVLTPESDS